MSDRCFLDTNVLMYAHDPSTGEKHRRARDLVERLWDSGAGVVSTQVLQELCVNLQRKCAVPMPIEEVRRVLQDYLSWEVVTNSPHSILDALDLQIRFRVSFWDAMIIQAAETGGCATLYSEDFANNQKYGSLKVVNPFL